MPSRKRQNRPRNSSAMYKTRAFRSRWTFGHFVNKLPIGNLSLGPQSRSAADYARPQSNGPPVPVAAETSIFTTAAVICVRMGEALRTYHAGVKVPRAADRFDRFKQPPSCARAKVEITISARTLRGRVFRVSRVGYFGHPPDCSNDESTAPCIAKLGQSTQIYRRRN